MSGGSWDYLYGRIEDAASTLQNSKEPLRRAFGKHMVKVAKAMHDIEWVDSCDYSPGDEIKSIEDVLDGDGKRAVLEECMAHAEGAMRELQAALAAVKKGGRK